MKPKFEPGEWVRADKKYVMLVYRIHGENRNQHIYDLIHQGSSGYLYLEEDLRKINACPSYIKEYEKNINQQHIFQL